MCIYIYVRTVVSNGDNIHWDIQYTVKNGDMPRDIALGHLMVIYRYAPGQTSIDEDLSW